MNSTRGFFVLDRAIFEHPLFQREFCDGWAFAWMLSEAAWKPRRVRISGRWVDLERGQFIHSLRFMARRFKWSIKRVQGLLGRLAADGTISIRRENDGLKKGTAKETASSVISICNYDDYQFPPGAEETAKETAWRQDGDKAKKEIKERAAAAAAGGSEIQKIAFEAVELSDQIYTIFGVDPADPKGWSTLPEWVETGLKSGWSANIVRIACRRVASRHKPGKKLPESHRYLAGAIQDEHDNAAVPPPFTPPNPQEIGNGQAVQQREFNLLRKIDGKGGNVGGRGGGFVAVALEAAQRAAAANRSGR